ncbi:MAG: cysteine desulfurase NifS [Candidatus Omnitrophota bacterium]|nr:cysteine desulfurase NifS [Candidatus Omnitrophota bacterium]
MRRVYLDHVATTQPLPEVVEAMMPYLRDFYGNPMSLHDVGVEAKRPCEEARGKVAALIGARPEEIVFTSCGTESNNMALKGAAWANISKGKHIVTTQIEHHSVLNAANALEKMGFEVTYVPVDKYGLVEPKEIEKAIRKDTVLVSVMHANNEIGTIEPIPEIAKITKARGILLHTDAVASAGNIPVNVNELNVDLLSFAANQFYGPKGIGALYIRKGVKIMPLLHGGFQERGLRAGTDNVPGIVGLGKAAELAARDLNKRKEKIIPLRDKLTKGLLAGIKNVYLNGHPTNRLPGNVNVSVEFVEGESMLLFLNNAGVMVASGSSCTSQALKVSHVLSATGMEPALAQGSLLFSLGIDNTEDDIDYVLEKMPPIVDNLRKISPFYKG